jgi:hypothetical protein
MRSAPCNRHLCTFWKEAFFEQINTKKRTPVNDAFDWDSQYKTQDAEMFERSLDWQEKQDRLVARYVRIAPPTYVAIPDKQCKERSDFHGNESRQQSCIYRSYKLLFHMIVRMPKLSSPITLTLDKA